MRIACVLTCHNRAQHTLDCLRSLFDQELSPEQKLTVYVVDDGSTDGTSAQVEKFFPSAELISGKGDLFWCGGMRRGFAEALKKSYDYYLWINDDTKLLPGALGLLLDTHRSLEKEGQIRSIVVGSAMSPTDGLTSYGGWRTVDRWRRGGLVRVQPGSAPIFCDTFNGNCVLIHSSVSERIGNLDPAFTHAMGDIDYGLRSISANCSNWVAPGFAALCEPNSGTGLWTDEKLKLRERWKRLLGPKGLPPAEWLVFTRRHYGSFWPVYWANPYVRFWVRGLAIKLFMW